MNEATLVTEAPVLKPLTPEQDMLLCQVVIDALENETVEEVAIDVQHFINEGVYYRTCRVPKGITILGAFIKIPTTVIVSGDCFVTLGNTIGRLTGYHVIKAEAGRRQLFKSVDQDTFVTMCFKTSATTVEDAEKEFTDEWKLLTTNREKL